MIRWFTLFAGAGLILTGCATIDFTDAPDALLSNSSGEVTAEITQTISAALNGAPVNIAPDALTKTSRLIIERREALGPDGIPIMGRRFEKPDHFVLKSSGSRCALWHEQSGDYHVLELAECTPAP